MPNENFKLNRNGEVVAASHNDLITEIVTPEALDSIRRAQDELIKLIELQKKYNDELLRTKALKGE